MKEFKELGISENILKVIEERAFTKPSEIQTKTIPLVLEGKDLIAGSATGSGKTLAFGTGIIMGVEKGKGIQALILTPTRELAEQVGQEIQEFSQYKELEVTPIYGGVNMNNQTKKLAYTDIIVATPGRLLDHIRQNNIGLANIKYLVLDEADRMWDMGFKEDVSKIVDSCPKQKQTLLFSATISSELEDFSKKYMNTPKEIAVENKVDPSKLQQVYYDVRDDEKFSLLTHLLQNETSHLVMIFSNTRRNADMVAKNLELQGIDAQVIHGGMEQNKRNKVLKKFDNNTVNVLVCTDVAARGLDIEDISHVYNYDVPSDHRDYIHRIGRTARAGKDGIAINLLASRDYDNFATIQKNYPEMHVKRETTPKFKKVYVKLPPRRENRRSPQRRGGPSRGGNNRRSPPRRRGRTDSRGPLRGRGGPSRRENRRGPPRGRSDNRNNGFRGSGRNTRRNHNKRN